MVENRCIPKWICTKDRTEAEINRSKIQTKKSTPVDPKQFYISIAASACMFVVICALLMLTNLSPSQRRTAWSLSSNTFSCYCYLGSMLSCNSWDNRKTLLLKRNETRTRHRHYGDIYEWGDKWSEKQMMEDTHKGDQPEGSSPRPWQTDDWRHMNWETSREHITWSRTSLGSFGAFL